MQQSFDFTRAEQLRDEGIQQAAEHAEQEIPGWNKQAFRMLMRFLSIRLGPFLMEDFRQWAEPSGLPQPTNLRAYGSVAKKAAHLKLIKRIGYGKVKNEKAHCTPATIWIKNQTNG